MCLLERLYITPGVHDAELCSLKGLIWPRNSWRTVAVNGLAMYTFELPHPEAVSLRHPIDLPAPSVDLPTRRARRGRDRRGAACLGCVTIPSTGDGFRIRIRRLYPPRPATKDPPAVRLEAQREGCPARACANQSAPPPRGDEFGVQGGEGRIKYKDENQVQSLVVASARVARLKSVTDLRPWL
ncbi:hypothetical protein K438DRAFT_1962225 [Mycena galopus ATCC 62051]|nr:hypothetical protein K438DRAFT_1962225 [Mycena galopus ATCC 62051]